MKGKKTHINITLAQYAHPVNFLYFCMPMSSTPYSIFHCGIKMLHTVRHSMDEFNLKLCSIQTKDTEEEAEEIERKKTDIKWAKYNKPLYDQKVFTSTVGTYTDDNYCFFLFAAFK